MGGVLPGVSTLMTACDKILAAFNLNNQRGNWLYQSERNKILMVAMSPEQAANLFYTVEVNLNQTTTMVGYMPSTVKVRAVDAKPKWKAKDKAPANTMRPEMITQIIRKQFLCVTDVCNWRINSQRFFVV